MKDEERGEMKTVVKMFKPEFAELVRNGKKLQTIRPTPKRMPKVGDMVSLRCWKDKPYRSKHQWLGLGEIIEVSRVDITASGVILNGFVASGDEIARDDGFSDFSEMLKWFEREHGLPFQGIMLRWRLIGI